MPNLNYTVDVLGHSSQHWQCTPWASNWYGAWCYCVARENLSSLMWLWVGLQLSQCHDKQSELVVCLDSRKSQKITPFLSPKTVHITLPTDGFVLNFFSDEFPTCHSMDCCLDSSSQQWHHVSSPIMMWSCHLQPPDKLTHGVLSVCLWAFMGLTQHDLSNIPTLIPLLPMYCSQYSTPYTVSWS